MKRIIAILVFAIGFSSFAQVGIGTTNPQGALDITSSNMGLVLPRVPSLESITDGQGNPPVDGTIVYDISREKTCQRIQGKWLCTGFETGSLTPTTTHEIPTDTEDIVYVKASNTGTSNDNFGNAISISDDGMYLAVGAVFEDSNATGINGDESNNNSSNSGAVYLYVRSGTTWSQQAYIKASNTDASDFFGISVSLNNDGSRLAVGAYSEDSNATGINGDQTNNSSGNSGAVYVFSRSGTTWTQEAYIKASNTGSSDLFGNQVALDDTATRLVVSASSEDSNATGINGDETNNSASSSGAVYVFVRSGTTWAQEAYIKASNTEASDIFGDRLTISGDGTRIGVGAYRESSNATGINGDESDNSTSSSGAVYLFSRSGTTWSQEAYIKASNTEANDYFGRAVSLDQDGDTLVVGAYLEDSDATGIGGDESNNNALTSGAAYVFSRSGTTWSQQAYIKSSNSEAGDAFGVSMSLSGSGDALVVGATGEDSIDSGIDGDETDNTGTSSGAGYVFTRTGGVWTQAHYLKASNVNLSDSFGNQTTISNDGTYICVSAPNEDSNATGINGDQTDNSVSASGAAYIITPF
ncbi:MAG: FG-GAP repeat protein [Flavobacteriaceae bacterium]|nr:FG-GAP repeat protein [Flavobacteriaceae bacterium]